MPTLSRIRVYPIKALDGEAVDRIEVADGTMAHDRAYAMFDADGNYVNGRQNRRVHRLESSFDVEAREVALGVHGEDETRRFDLTDDGDVAAMEEWLSEFFGEPITVERASTDNFNDSTGGLSPAMVSAPGPTVVSTATLREVASWYPDLGVEDLRRRLRANLEIEGVEPFWEDRLFGDPDSAVEFEIGDVTLYGIMSKPRCVVPTRDPETGDRHRGFIETFVENREATFPEWADPDDLGGHVDFEEEHYYYLTVVTRLPRTDPRELQVGDEVRIQGETSVRKTL